MIKIKYSKLAYSILICLLAGFIGSFFTSSSISSWYSQINKPSFNPPNWIFGPVWTTLYILMGISLYLILVKSSNSEKKKYALIVFYIQLFLNTLWSILFFGLQSPLLGLIEITLLWCVIVFTIFKFYKIYSASAFLLMPYLLWVSFASILNLSIYLLN